MKHNDSCPKLTLKTPKNSSLLAMHSPKSHHLRDSNHLLPMKSQVGERQKQVKPCQEQLQEISEFRSAYYPLKKKSSNSIGRSKIKTTKEDLCASNSMISKERVLKKSQSSANIQHKEKKITKKRQLKIDKHACTQYTQDNTAELMRVVTQVPRSKIITEPIKEYKESNEYDHLYYVGSLIQPKHNEEHRHHLSISLSTLRYCQKIRVPLLRELSKQIVQLPPTTAPYTFVLDLDETLIHCNESVRMPCDSVVEVVFPTGEVVEAGVNVRGYARQLLRELAKMGEVIVFTASHEFYANAVLQLLDPKGKYIAHRLYRGSCWCVDDKTYIKDLRILMNRRMENVLLVDNAAHSYCFQLGNGVPIIPFYDQKHDDQLKHLLNYVKMIVALKEKYPFKTLAQINGEYFQMNKYMLYDNANAVINKVYRNVHK